MLHAPTAFVLTFALAVTCGAVLLFLWNQTRRHLALAYWGAAHSLGAVGLPLLALRAVAPGWISIDLGNALLAVSYGLIWAGARRFMGRRVPPLAVVAGALLWLAACRVPDFYASIAMRVLAMGLVAATYNILAAWELSYSNGVASFRSQRLLIWVLLANAAAYLLRIPFLLFQPIQAPISSYASSLWLDVLVILGTALAASTALVLVSLVREQEEREANAALRAARDAADEASAGKTRFLAHLSHELRTPLNGVLGLAQALAGDPSLGAEQHDRAAMLERAGRHLNALLTDVLDLSRIEAGRLELVPVPTLLCALLEEVTGLVRGAARAKNVVLLEEIAPNLPEAVLCDPLRVRQILHNLLGNAVKFTPSGGRVTLAVRRRAQGGLVLTITDDGPGVPEDFRDRLFEDYTRATREAAKGDGTGLGLAISARLAQAMDGSIRFGTPPGGRGSVFEAWLPLPDAEPPEAPAVAEATPAAAGIPPRGMTVLVVDDIAVNRLVLRAMLERAGHRVLEAADGAAALAIVADPSEAGLPEVVLMDVLMPGMDGLEATRRIRALPGKAARLRILAVTAGAMTDEVAACLAAGMDGHVTKPVERAVLLAALSGPPPGSPSGSPLGSPPGPPFSSPPGPARRAARPHGSHPAAGHPTFGP
ncbi:hybrid sensor histidine kinase/response regulator [Muricoccus aerilatus]|uniref:hybrid sensor histidine kinase/response regulator n=1 Tax=Muricoccus aerilatus TaxID=452982 RepID=UPI000694EFF5|nr:ATP-binding protein [Roseomonas aerilata]